MICNELRFKSLSEWKIVYSSSVFALDRISKQWKFFELGGSDDAHRYSSEKLTKKEAGELWQMPGWDVNEKPKPKSSHDSNGWQFVRQHIPPIMARLLNAVFSFLGSFSCDLTNHLSSFNPKHVSFVIRNLHRTVFFFRFCGETPRRGSFSRPRIRN